MKKSELEQIFSSFNNKKVLIVGDAMIDAYMWGNIERMSPEAPVPVLRPHKEEIRLGGAANVALNLSIPILNSNQTNINRQIGRIQKDQLTINKENTELALSANIRNSVLNRWTLFIINCNLRTMSIIQD